MEAKLKTGYIAAITGALNNIDCGSSSAILNCTSNYNRSECANTPMTCGTCLDGYNGEFGDHNTKCYLPIDKELIKFETRSCPGNCYQDQGHGICQYKDQFNGLTVDSCRIGDACDVQCQCYNDWHGIACHLSSEDIIIRSKLRSKLIQSSLAIDESFYNINQEDDIKQRILSLKAALHRPDEMTSEMSTTAFTLI